MELFMKKLNVFMLFAFLGAFLNLQPAFSRVVAGTLPISPRLAPSTPPMSAKKLSLETLPTNPLDSSEDDEVATITARYEAESDSESKASTAKPTTEVSLLYINEETEEVSCEVIDDVKFTLPQLRWFLIQARSIFSGHLKKFITLIDDETIGVAEECILPETDFVKVRAFEEPVFPTAIIFRTKEQGDIKSLKKSMELALWDALKRY